LEMPTVLSALLHSGHRIEAVPLTGPWFDIGTPENLVAARAAFAG
jgi:NDP-sugar pyrophosphorylase family protein